MNELIITICYDKKTIWYSRNEAISFFLNCYFSSEGSEKARYEKILKELIEGKNECKD
jgi:hypothetical protein